MNNLIIEIPNISDQEMINELAVQEHNLHVKWRNDLFIKCDDMMPKERLEDLINQKEILVARLNDKVIGFITFNIREKSNQQGFRDRKQLNIDVICVDENLRGKGIGTKILEHIKEFAKENNCTDLYLTVNEENLDAIKLYEKFGFQLKNIAYSMKIK